MAVYRFLQEEAYACIRERIAAGELKDDVIYSETRLAAELGISRTPVKDALVRLSQEKLVDILPSRGFQLHRMTAEDVWNTCQLRTAVEGFCVLHLAHRKDTPEGAVMVEQLRQDLRQMEQIPDSSATEEYWAADLAFHRHLVEFSENPEFISLFESYHHRMSVIAKESFHSPNRRQAALREHRAILAAVENCRDREDLTPYHAARIHMEASRDIVLRKL